MNVAVPCVTSVYTVPAANITKMKPQAIRVGRSMDRSIPVDFCAPLM